MVVGTIGAGVPEEILAASGHDVVPVEAAPGGTTELADRAIEPLVGDRARSQLQRILDGTYAQVELFLFSREEEAPLRLFYALRELRRLDGGLPPLHLVDLQHLPRPEVRRWNVARLRELCALLGVDERALPAAIRACNERRRTHERGGETYLAGSLHDASFVPTREDCDPLDAIAERYEHPLLARARASSEERARAIADDAVATGAARVLALYYEGDDGLRWEFPELRDACEARGLSVELRDHVRA